MAGLLVVIVTLTPCSIVLNFMVDRQVFGVTIIIHGYGSKKEMKYKTDESHQIYFLHIMRYSIITTRQSGAILHISRLRILPCPKGRTLTTPCGSAMK